MHTSTLQVCYTHKRFSSAAVFSLSLRELCSDEVREVSVEPQEMDLIGVRTISPRPTLLAVSREGGGEGRRGRKEGEGRRGSDGGGQRKKRKGGGKEGGKKGGRRGRQREESSRQPAMRSHKETGRTRTTNLVIQWLGHSVLPCERGCL